jgi:nitrous oxidase accessory protein NosD
MKIEKITLTKQKWEIVGGVLLVAVFVLPVLVFAGGRKDMYVDGSKSGTEDGTSAHPYHTISEALKHANNRTDVHVAKGTYEDNIEIPKGVKVFGKDSDDVTIRSKSSKKVVVSMKKDTTIDGVTIEKGKSGIWVAENAKVSISKCVIRKNENDGIKIGGDGVKDSTRVSITKSRIEKNGKDGIYSGKRKLSLIDNEIIKIKRLD